MSYGLNPVEELFVSALGRFGRCVSLLILVEVGWGVWELDELPERVEFAPALMIGVVETVTDDPLSTR